MAGAAADDLAAGRLHQAELGQAPHPVVAGEVLQDLQASRPAAGTGGDDPEIQARPAVVTGTEIQQGVPAIQQGIPAIQQGIPAAGVVAGQAGEQLPPIVPGIVVGRPVDFMNNPPPQSLSGLYAISATGGELTEEEVIVLNYGASLMIFASIDLLATILHVVLAVVRITETPGRIRNYSDLLWVAFIFGPICGLIGAKKLRRNLVIVYFAFCLVKTAYQLAWAVVVLQLWHVITALVQVWVTKIVSTFWRALHRIPPERCEQLLAQKAQVTMMCW